MWLPLTLALSPGRHGETGDAGTRSQNTKPSRVTGSPTVMGMGRRNIGPALAKVWNSPFSAHGSTPAGSSASRSRSKRRPARLAGSLRGSRQAMCATRPAPIMSRASLRGLDAPHRKQRRDAGAGELGLAIAADVLQEQVAERHGLHALRHLARDELPHHRLIGLVRAGIGDRQHMQRQAGGLGLRLDQRAPHAVHGDAIEGGVDGGDQPDQLDVIALAQQVQRPGRILARAPAQQCFHADRACIARQPPARSSTCTPLSGLSRLRHLGWRSVCVTSLRPACQCSSIDRRENS